MSASTFEDCLKRFCSADPSIRRESARALFEGRLLILLDLAKVLSASKTKDLALGN